MISPKGFIRSIPKDKIGRFPLYLAWVVGMVFLLEKASTSHLNQLYSLPVIIISSVVFAIPIGFILVYLLAFFLKIAGNLFDGKGSFKQLITACIYGRVPEIFVLVIWFLLILYFGDAAFSSQSIRSSPSLYVSVLLISHFVFFIWEIIASVQGIALMQQFSPWKGLFTYIIAFFLVLMTSYFIESICAFMFRLNAHAVESLG
ncbi:MAG: hypothetical protein SP4CHLAM5_03390 [Chlamydiia bacterium]|nr:hypothetical protein [Chlamydiia bacterium]MCH9618213.1 hypothetical protein [Chlamydiia bacterium]MCH9624064.1 hypothetical protein [Chlamydiia bacterium]